jgi:hypothetical protein
MTAAFGVSLDLNLTFRDCLTPKGTTSEDVWGYISVPRLGAASDVSQPIRLSSSDTLPKDARSPCPQSLGQPQCVHNFSLSLELGKPTERVG